MSHLYKIIVPLCIMLLNGCVQCNKERRTFPENFLFGVATSSYQVEGGWDVDGKTPSMWDYGVHKNPDIIKDKSNGDVACDAYHQTERDVEMLRELGVDHFRFSISWPRILPSGFANKINQKGIDYYNKLIDELLKYNIIPFVQLYHWDLPQSLQELGGWLNPSIVDWFEDFARVAFEAFGDRVTFWGTINEPELICSGGYENAMYEPRIKSRGVGCYLCSKNVLLAHAKAWRLYDEHFRSTQNGQIGIVVSLTWAEPATNSDEDRQAAKDLMNFFVGEYIHPIYSETGDYPPTMRSLIDKRSKEQGFPRSRLPTFTKEEIDLIKGTGDFLGINHYSSMWVYRNSSVPESKLGLYDYSVPSYMDDVYVGGHSIAGNIPRAIELSKDVPTGFLHALRYLKNNYNNPPIFITENGFVNKGGLEDDDRVHYMRDYLTALLEAIKEGCDIRAYTVWSLMDSFEWTSGYTYKFGLYEVDMEDPKRKRTARKSALVYKEIIRTLQVDPSYDPKCLNITIDEGY